MNYKGYAEAKNKFLKPKDDSKSISYLTYLDANVDIL